MVIVVGMILVIMIKGIDFLVGFIVGLFSMVVVDMVSYGVVVGIFVGFGVGFVCGFINGILIVKFKFLDFIVMFGMFSIFCGVVLIYING